MIEGHDYSIHCNGPSGRSRMYAFLAVITAFLAPLAQHGVTVFLRRYWGDDLDVDKAALFFGGFTALLLYGVMLNVFDGYIWRMSLGARMFRLIGLTAPPDLNGEYRGTLEFQSATDRGAEFRGDFFMRISQTWEQISLIVQREAESGGLVLIHSDIASIRIGMMAGVNTLRFVYTFEENLPRAEGTGSTARQFSGAATFEFRRDGEAWQVTGHFFDDIGRSGQVSLRQGLAGTGPATVAQSPPTAA
jgi:SMODS-associating 2TM, beta-strand rich effector domain